MEVSVIIPVYNAERYVRIAVESAIVQREVSEIILIEDNSPDNALEICESLVSEYSKIKLLRHPNGENRGASASRNLGVREAKGDYISFLDADDFFAANRFKKTMEVFSENPEADGVYEAIGIFNKTPEDYKLYSVSKPIAPPKLFHFFLRGTYGHFSTDGITVKRSFFEKAGYFNEKLPLHQDSELWLRMAYFGKLYAGNLNTPVAFARRHENNRISTANKESNLKFWKAVKKFFEKQQISPIDKFLINRKIARLESNSSSQYLKSIIKNSLG
ncbi:glycosyltransferase family 2 protein [Salinimicrobium flavum]|uniref:Glycosyltransferase family 2 protein n=1 Tax=Salinimicrobium flavum TaxID=1737065 RepID=A0ABW5J017_9FLAO